MSPSPQDADRSVPEDVAHRILARAAEIEAREAPAIPLSRLRQVAAEAGIAPAALDQAIREASSPPAAGRLRRGLDWVGHRLSTSSPLAPLHALTLNVVAFAATWVLAGLGARLAAALQSGWIVSNGLAIAATLLGVGMAVRVRARLSAILLAIIAAAQLAEYPLHLIYGIGVVQGAQTKWALLLAGGFGILLSRILTRRQLPAQEKSGPDTSAVTEGESAPAPPASDYTTLRLRPATALR